MSDAPTLQAQLNVIRDMIPMDFLILSDAPGATGPTQALDLVKAVRLMVAHGRDLQRRLAAAKARLRATNAERALLVRALKQMLNDYRTEGCPDPGCLICVRSRAAKDNAETILSLVMDDEDV